MENWYIPYQTAQLPVAQKVWVLAPHPDDEVFGCGGAALSYAAQNAQVHVTVVSSGTGYAQADNAAQIQSTREAETNAALKLMGLAPAQFWQLPDRGLGQCADLPQKLRQELLQHQFEVVFTPSLDEVHPDHLAVTRALFAALEQINAEGGALPWVVQYEVGAPLKPNLLLNLTPLWSRKQQAMQCFKSQQQVQDYAKHIEALNTFRTYSLPATVTHAEAYRVLAPAEVLQAASENRWVHAVLAAAEAGAEALQLQVISQDQLMARLQDQWRTDSQAMRNHEEALLKRVDVLSDELKQLGIENERKRIEIERLTQFVSGLQQTLLQTQQELSTSLAQTQSELAQTKTELAQTKTELAQEQALRQVMLNSNSWRITKPLRWLVQLFSSNQS